MLFSCYRPDRLSGYLMVLPWAHCRICHPTVLPTHVALLSRAAKCILAIAVSLLSSISPFPVSPPRLFCSSLSSRTMRTLLMRSRLAACRPARKKWQLRMTVTWSHMRPRRWWQVNNFPRLLKPFLPHLLTAVLIEYAAWCSGSLMSLFMTDVHQRVNMTFVPWQKSEHLTICTFVWNVLVL